MVGSSLQFWWFVAVFLFVLCALCFLGCGLSLFVARFCRCLLPQYCEPLVGWVPQRYFATTAYDDDGGGGGDDVLLFSAARRSCSLTKKMFSAALRSTAVLRRRVGRTVGRKVRPTFGATHACPFSSDMRVDTDADAGANADAGDYYGTADGNPLLRNFLRDDNLDAESIERSLATNKTKPHRQAFFKRERVLLHKLRSNLPPQFNKLKGEVPAAETVSNQGRLELMGRERELYDLHLSDKQKWTVAALGRKYRVSQRRVQGIIMLEELTDQRIARGDFDEDVDPDEPKDLSEIRVDMSDYEYEVEPEGFLDLVASKKSDNEDNDSGSGDGSGKEKAGAADGGRAGGGDDAADAAIAPDEVDAEESVESGISAAHKQYLADKRAAAVELTNQVRE